MTQRIYFISNIGLKFPKFLSNKALVSHLYIMSQNFCNIKMRCKKNRRFDNLFVQPGKLYIHFLLQDTVVWIIILLIKVFNHVISVQPIIFSTFRKPTSSIFLVESNIGLALPLRPFDFGRQ